MDPLIRLALGCLTGAREASEGLDEVRNAWRAVSSSAEFRELETTVAALVGDLLRQADAGLVERLLKLEPDGGDWRAMLGAVETAGVGVAWARLSRTSEFQTLLATGAAIVRDLLEQSPARRPGG